MPNTLTFVLSEASSCPSITLKAAALLLRTKPPGRAWFTASAGSKQVSSCCPFPAQSCPEPAGCKGEMGHAVPDYCTCRRWSYEQGMLLLPGQWARWDLPCCYADLHFIAVTLTLILLSFVTRGPGTPCSTASIYSVRTNPLGHSSSKRNLSSAGWAITRHKEYNSCCYTAWDKLSGWSFPQEQAVLSLFISQQQLLLAAVRDE